MFYLKDDFSISSKHTYRMHFKKVQAFNSLVTRVFEGFRTSLWARSWISVFCLVFGIDHMGFHDRFGFILGIWGSVLVWKIISLRTTTEVQILLIVFTRFKISFIIIHKAFWVELVWWRLIFIICHVLILFRLINWRRVWFLDLFILHVGVLIIHISLRIRICTI